MGGNILKTALIVSGSLQIDDKVTLCKFWQAFINFQKNIPSDFEIHASFCVLWQNDATCLVSHAFGSRCISQPEFMCEKAIGQGETTVDPTMHMNLKESLWRLATTRRKSIELFQKIEHADDYEKIILCDVFKNFIDRKSTYGSLFDASLPKDYVYLASDQLIDFGYDTQLIVTSPRFLSQLLRFDDFVLDFFQKYDVNADGSKRLKWPWVFQPSGRLLIAFSPFIQDSAAKLRRYAQSQKPKFKEMTVLNRLLHKIFSICEQVTSEVTETAETSLISTGRLFREQTVFGKADYRKLSKAYFIENNIRAFTRFIAGDDFRPSANLGKIIDPVSVTVILSEFDAEDHKIFEENVGNLPIRVDQLMVRAADRIRLITRNKDGIYSETEIDLTHKVELLQSTEMFDSTARIYVATNRLTTFLSCEDWIYFNSVSKYLLFQEKKAIISQRKQDGSGYYEDFPGLQNLNKAELIMSQVFLLNSALLRAFLLNVDKSGDLLTLSSLKMPESVNYASIKKFFI